MMNNLFSIFDPSTSYFLSLNWLILFMCVFFYSFNVYVLNHRIKLVMMNTLFFINSDMMSNLNPKNMKNLIFFMTFFIFIFTMNLLSLLPFVFTSTAHLSVTMSLALPFWISLFFKGWFSFTKKMLIHLVPLSTPLILSPFMVLIETISSLIRPFTLSIRLAANLIAGHLLISLLSETLNNNLLIFFMVSMILNMLLLLEIAVAMIQSYVFIVLMSLYLNEI